MTPIAQMSIDGPTRLTLPSSTSGAMYRSEPIFIFSTLIVLTPAIPKSTILIKNDDLEAKRMFSSFRSLGLEEKIYRWINFYWWQ